MENYEINLYIAKDTILFIMLSAYLYYKINIMHTDIQKAKNSSLMIWQKVLTLN